MTGKRKANSNANGNNRVVAPQKRALTMAEIRQMLARARSVAEQMSLVRRLRGLNHAAATTTTRNGK
jgi:hypothetical protein